MPDNVSGANGEEEVCERFRDVYKTLYNSWGSEKEMESLKSKVKQLIKEDDTKEVQKLTGQVVKMAACKLKPSKNDVSQGYTSDAILNAPDIFFDNMACVYRSWLVHGTVSLNLLACAFLPLLKNSLKDPCDTGS